MTARKSGMASRLGATMDAANENLQRVGASLVRKVDEAASSAERRVGNARAFVEKGVRAASANVRRRARSTELGATKVADNVENAMKGAARRVEAETRAALGNARRAARGVEGDAARALDSMERTVRGKVTSAAAGAERAAVKVERAMAPQQPANRQKAETSSKARRGDFKLSLGRTTITASARRTAAPTPKVSGDGPKLSARSPAKTPAGRRRV